MADGDSFSFNNNVTGDKNQLNQGKTVKASMVNKGDTNDLDFFAQLRESLKQEAPDTDTVSRAEQEVIKPLEDLCGVDLPESEAEQKTLKEKIYELVRNLDPYVPYIRKTIAAFAEGALKTVPPPISWVVGGCMEVVREHRQP